MQLGRDWRGRWRARGARPSLPGRGRGPRSTARSSVAMAALCAPSLAPSRSSGCLSSASSVTGSRPPSAASRREPREHAGRRVGERVAAGIVDRDLPARERGDDAARQRAVGRHQRGGLVRRFERLAQRDRDGERFLLGIGGLDHARARRARCRSRRRSPLLPVRACQRSVVAAGRSASETPDARGRARLGGASCATSPRVMPMRSSSACMANCAWPAAGAPSCVLSSASPAISAQTGVVEIAVEAGQHHGAVRQRGDGGEQLGGRRHRAGRAGGDHRRRCAAASRLASASISRSRRSAGSIGAPLGEDRAASVGARS